MSEVVESFTGFMCMTDFEHDARGASDGANVYPSEAAVRRERPCVAECGIVEVTVTLSRIVQPSDFDGLLPQSSEAPTSAGCEAAVPRIAVSEHDEL